MNSFSKEKVCAQLEKRGLKIRVEMHECVDSTNNLAKKKAADSEHADVIIAREQSAGRGQRGRSFFSPPNGIYMSVILHSENVRCRTSLITHAAAVAVCRALKKACGIDAGIKWVNDIILNGRKVCGILTESVLNTKRIIVGIGVNVGQIKFPKELSRTAASIGQADRVRLVVEIINELISITQSSEDIVSEYSKNMILIGHDISYTMNQMTYIGRALRIDTDGALVVLQGEDEIRLISGQVSLDK